MATTTAASWSFPTSTTQAQPYAASTSMPIGHLVWAQQYFVALLVVRKRHTIVANARPKTKALTAVLVRACRAVNRHTDAHRCTHRISPAHSKRRTSTCRSGSKDRVCQTCSTLDRLTDRVRDQAAQDLDFRDRVRRSQRRRGSSGLLHRTRINRPATSRPRALAVPRPT